MSETKTTFSVRNQSRMDTLMRGAAPPEAVDPTRLQSLDLLRAIKILLERAIEENADKRFPSYEKIESAGLRSETEPQLDLGSRQTRVILEKLLKAKEADRLSPRYLQTLRSHLTRFVAAFDTNIGFITVADMENWLRAQPIQPRSRNNIRGSIVTLFHFARKHGYLQKGQATEADELAMAKDSGGKIGILKPEKLASVLNEAPERVRLFLALGAFTGMRSSEILRLEWGEVNFERRFITVAAEKAKTATRRLVPILPNLMLWLAPYQAATGLLFKTRRDADRAIAFAKGCQVNWPNNAMRHSYATYRLAATADAARVALEMGNSPQKLMRNYRELADEKDAAAWFSICPRVRSKG
jgi:integrase